MRSIKKDGTCCWRSKLEWKRLLFGNRTGLPSAEEFYRTNGLLSLPSPPKEEREADGVLWITRISAVEQSRPRKRMINESEQL